MTPLAKLADLLGFALFVAFLGALYVFAAALDGDVRLIIEAAR